MSITRLQKKVEILELFNKVKSSECHKQMQSLSLERKSLVEIENKMDFVCQEMNAVDSQFLVSASQDVSVFNLEQKFNYASWLEQQHQNLIAELNFSETHISNMENQLKNILKQAEKINEKIEVTKNELNRKIDDQFILDNQ